MDDIFSHFYEMSSRSSGENEIAAAIWGRDRSNWGGLFWTPFLFSFFFFLFLRYELFSIGGVHPDRTNRGGTTNTLSTLPFANLSQRPFVCSVCSGASVANIATEFTCAGSLAAFCLMKAVKNSPLQLELAGNARNLSTSSMGFRRSSAYLSRNLLQNRPASVLVCPIPNTNRESRMQV